MAVQLLGEKDESIKLSSFVAAFESKDSQAHRCSRGMSNYVNSQQLEQLDFDLACQVPKAAIAALGHTLIYIDTSDKKNFAKLIDCNGQVQFSEVAFHQLVDVFNDNSGDPSQAAGEVLLHLKDCNLVSLNLQRCSLIPSTAWQKLRGASWTNLKEADFSACLVLQIWLRCLASSLRHRVFFWMLRAIVTAVSLTTFDNIERPKMWNTQLQMVGLAKVTCKEERQQIAFSLSPQSLFDHSRCFGRDTKGADGAADLLEVLRNSPLEKLNFDYCYQIPSTAWQKLRGASWTNLKEADFSACLVLQIWLRCLASSLRRRVFFLECSGPLSRLFLWQHLATLKGQKCEIDDSCKWSDLQKSLARGAATDCRPFFMAYLCHSLTWHIVIFIRLPKPLRCAIYAEIHKQHRHLQSCQEPLMWHLVGGNFWGPPPLMVHLPLKWRNEDPVAFEKMHSLPLGYRINGKRIINLLCWFACLACHYDPESKAFLGMQEGKDEEEWREMKRNI